MPTTRRPRSAVVLALVLLVAAACGKSTNKHDSAKDRQQIVGVWTTFFDGKNTDTAAKAALLENGAKLKSILQSGLNNPTASQSSTKVKTVKFLSESACKDNGLSSPCALVTHDLLLNGRPALAGQQSYAVFVGGKWKVSQISFCGLVALGGSNCPK